jgi:cytoskeletal protein CcmA (bactofilin family)
MSLFGGQSRGARDREARRGATETPRPAERAEGAAPGAPGRAETRGSSVRSQGGDVASVGKSILFKGDLSGDEDLEIEGRIEGQIQLSDHQLTVGAHGRVKAEIKAKAVVVIGHVTGNVEATERIEVQASGVVEGDIRAPRLLIQEGAVVNGSVEMTRAEGAAAPKPAPPKVAVQQGG